MTDECTLEFNPGGPARLRGVLTFGTCTQLYEAMEHHLRKNSVPETIDLTEVSMADSAGLALLLEWQAIGRKAGRVITMTGVPGGLIELARLCDADDVLTLNARESA